MIRLQPTRQSFRLQTLLAAVRSFRKRRLGENTQTRKGKTWDTSGSAWRPGTRNRITSAQPQIAQAVMTSPPAYAIRRLQCLTQLSPPKGPQFILHARSQP